MTKPALAICAHVITADPAKSEIQLMPAGHFRAQDGRPHEVASGYYIDAAVARRLIDRANARRGDYVVDYEHQTLNSQANGQPAPAAGWFKQLEWREGDGLYAVNVRWTGRAKQHIADDEYRYISPVFEYDDETGAALDLYHAALTNDPGVDGMAQAVAAARRQFLPDDTDSETPMLEALIKALGLDQNTTEEQALGAVASLKKDHDDNDAQLSAAMEALEVEDADGIAEAVTALKADRDSAKQSVAALKNGKPDPSKYVPAEQFEAVKQDVAALRKQLNDDEVEELVQDGLDDGRLLPAQEDWARDLGQSNVAQLKSYLKNAQPVAALKRSQTNGEQPKDDQGNAVLTDNQKAVCKRMGMSEADYAASLQADQA